MKKTPLDRIINKTKKAMRIPEEIILPKKKKERAKPPKYDLSEEAFAKQIDEILGIRIKRKSDKLSHSRR